MKETVGLITSAIVVIFIVGTCGGVFEKSGEERCSISCGHGRMSKWTEGVWREHKPAVCECVAEEKK